MDGEFNGSQFITAQAGAEPPEYPFNPNLLPRAGLDLGVAVGLPAFVAHHLSMRNSLLANLALAQMHDVRASVFCSRDAEHYARTRRWTPASYTRRNVVAAVDELEAAGVVVHDRTLPSPSATRRSTIAAYSDLIATLGLTRADDVIYDLRHPIVLKDSSGELLPFTTTRRTRAMAADVAEQNNLLRSSLMQLRDPLWKLDDCGLYRGPAGRVVNPCRKLLYRVFNNGTWMAGGRWYGGWWQQLPATARANLAINGASVIEEDFSGCHLRLLCAVAGTDLPAGDPYQIEAIEAVCAGDARMARRIAKISFQILVNAETTAAAHGAVAAELQRTTPLGAYITASSIIRAIKGRYPAFRRLWHSGLGVRLQRIDSDIAADVMAAMRAVGVPVLPIHDSLIAAAPASSILLEAMEGAFSRGMAAAATLSS